MSYRVALFDLDGTVLDTLDDLTAAVNHAMISEGFPTHTRERVCAYVGNGIGNLIARAVPEGTSEATVARTLATFRTYYAAHCAVHTKPYEGVLEMLRTLRAAGVKTALVSNKADFAVQALAKDYFEGLFDVALGERADIPRKPAPDMVHRVLSELGATPADAVFIGDSDVDVTTAKNAGTDGIFVTWGFRDAACLRAAGAVRLVDSTKELAACILA